MNKNDRINKTRTMNCGYNCKIIAYRNSMDIDVEFIDNGEVVHNVTYDNFRNGRIKPLFLPTVFNVGIIGNSIISINGVKKQSYNIWQNMLRRCYDEKYHQKEPTYIGCTVCDEWRYFLNFEKWYEDNWYDIEGETVCLDKDILVKGNKIYSPNTCIFVPKKINSLFTKNDNSRGNLPIGVTLCRNGKYRAQINRCGSKLNLGYYSSLEEAFLSYKTAKEKYIKEIAEYYKDIIPKKLYNSMLCYIVEITD